MREFLGLLRKEPKKTQELDCRPQPTTHNIKQNKLSYGEAEHHNTMNITIKAPLMRRWNDRCRRDLKPMGFAESVTREASAMSLPDAHDSFFQLSFDANEMPSACDRSRGFDSISEDELDWSLGPHSAAVATPRSRPEQLDVVKTVSSDAEISKPPSADNILDISSSDCLFAAASTESVNGVVRSDAESKWITFGGEPFGERRRERRRGGFRLLGSSAEAFASCFFSGSSKDTQEKSDGTDVPNPAVRALEGRLASLERVIYGAMEHDRNAVRMPASSHSPLKKARRIIVIEGTELLQSRSTRNEIARAGGDRDADKNSKASRFSAKRMMRSQFFRNIRCIKSSPVMV